MKKTVKARGIATKPKSVQAHIKPERIAKLLLASWLLFILLCQLFSFEKFPQLLQSSGANSLGAFLLAALLVGAELISLPYLIDLRTTTRLIRLSRASGFLALGLLTILELLAYSSSTSIIYGATFDIPAGSWAFCFLAGLWILIIWANGMIHRPVSVSKKRK